MTWFILVMCRFHTYTVLDMMKSILQARSEEGLGIRATFHPRLINGEMFGIHYEHVVDFFLQGYF